MFTTDNTEGYKQYELDTMNKALELLLEGVDEGTDDYIQLEKHYSDKIQNRFFEGCSVDDLVGRPESCKLIEKESVTRDYDFDGINAIIEHPEHGRLMISDGFGGTDSLQGGAVRWRHGMVVKLQAGDTLDSLKETAWNDETSTFAAVVHGYDDQRPLLAWHGKTIESIAKSVGL